MIKVVALMLSLFVLASCAPSATPTASAPTDATASPEASATPAPSPSPAPTETPTAAPAPTDAPNYTVLPIPEDERLLMKNEAGDIVYAGMSREECERVLDVVIEDGWSTFIHNPLFILTPVQAFDNVILGLTAGEGWLLGGVAPGDDIQKAWDLYGEDYFDIHMSKSEQFLPSNNGIIYEFEGGYSVAFIYKDSGEIIAVNTHIVTQWPFYMLGNIYLRESGSGNARIEEFLCTDRALLEITHSGTGQFKLIVTGADGTEEVLLDKTGAYDGVIPVPRVTAADSPPSLDITAVGDWTIVSRYTNTNYDTINNQPEWSGTGDFVTPSMLCEGTWKITYEGEGPLLIRPHFHGGVAHMPPDIILEAEGPYVGEFTIEAEDYIGTYEPENSDGSKVERTYYCDSFEIRAGGSWTLKHITEG